MTSLFEGELRFDFPDGWDVAQFDSLAFYRRRFLKFSSGGTVCQKCEQRLRCNECGADRPDGAKGIDFLAIDGDDACWLIEVKDYRQTRRTDLLFLVDELAAEVRDTLACLVAMRTADDNAEQDLAAAALRCSRFRIVLHIEEPSSARARRSIHPANSLLANVQNKLQARLSPIDRRAEAVGLAHPGGKPWSVTSTA